jgi:predicted MPP superfamily phosphohydrolase
MNRRNFLKKIVYAGIGSGLLASYPLFIERYIIYENHYKIKIKGLPGEFTDFKILQLTDLHYGFLVPSMVIEYVVNKANKIDTDIIVCTGDYVHEKKATKQIDTVWPILNKLSAPMGVYSVLGNHDHWADFDRSFYWLNKCRQNLRHKVVPLVKNGKRIYLGGCGDLWEDEQNIDSTFSEVNPFDFKILLAHNPDSADEKFDTAINLIISGHTHGGQVNLPFIGTPVLPVKNKIYSSGLVRTKKTNVFISKGIGWAVLPVRFNCAPEIAVLHLFPE